MIVVAGSANTDLVARVAHHPQPGETLTALDYAIHQGGKGANQAVAAARLGAAVRFIGAAGDDEFGELIVAGLAQEAVDVRSIRRLPGHSGQAIITVDDAGENRIVLVPGANGRLDGDCVAADDMADATVVLMQLEVPNDFVNAALAAGRHAEVVLNAAPAAPLAQFDMTAVDWLLVNAGEAAFLLGEAENTSIACINKQAQRLRNQHDVGVIVTLGADGVLWIERDGTHDHILGRPTTAVDTTGAGDTFAGAFACARAEGSSVRDAIEMASVAGALSVTQAGARAGMPSHDALSAAMSEVSG